MTQQNKTQQNKPVTLNASLINAWRAVTQSHPPLRTHKEMMAILHLVVQALMSPATAANRPQEVGGLKEMFRAAIRRVTPGASPDTLSKTEALFDDVVAWAINVDGFHLPEIIEEELSEEEMYAMPIMRKIDPTK